MRLSETKEYERLLDKYMSDSDIYKLIDMMKQQQAVFEGNSDQFAYMRHTLERHEEARAQERKLKSKED